MHCHIIEVIAPNFSHQVLNLTTPTAPVSLTELKCETVSNILQLRHILPCLDVKEHRG
jgi:hypothetical protein